MTKSVDIYEGLQLPQVKTGKHVGQLLNIAHVIPLPAETPFGNMTLKHTKLIMRLDYVNTKIIEVYKGWKKAIEGEFDPNFDISLHKLYMEEIIYFLRISADEIIALSYLFHYRSKIKSYPKRIIIECYFDLQKAQRDEAQDGHEFSAHFSNHMAYLMELNSISNAYKHSFINSDLSEIGRNEPYVIALHLRRNNLENTEELYVVSLASVICGFNNFYSDLMKFVRTTAAASKKDS